MKKLQLTLRWNEAKDKPCTATRVAENIRMKLESYNRHAQLHAYTDGSTDPNNFSLNSGVGIYITDEKHSAIWQGGFHLRSDKNNFLAEAAAIATVLNALPHHQNICIWSDSKAAVLAIQNSAVSERRRIRAPGRAWIIGHAGL